MDPDVRRQYRPVQFVGLRLHAFKNVLRLLTAKHENHALDGIVVLLIPELAQPRRVAYLDIPNVLDTNGYSIVAADNYVSDIAGVTYQPNAAHIVRLPPLGVKSTARIRVIGAQCGHHLWNGQVISVEPGRIE